MEESKGEDEVDVTSLLNITDHWMNDMLNHLYSSNSDGSYIGDVKLRTQDGISYTPTNWSRKTPSKGIEISSTRSNFEAGRSILKVRASKIVPIPAHTYFNAVKSISPSTMAIDKSCLGAEIAKIIISEDAVDLNALECLYFTYSLGFPLWNRDFLTLERRRRITATFSVNGGPDTKQDIYLIANKSVEVDEGVRRECAKLLKGAPDHFLTPDISQIVRGRMNFAGYSIRPLSESACEVRYIVEADPLGWVPEFVVNLIATDQAQVINNCEVYLLLKSAEATHPRNKEEETKL